MQKEISEEDALRISPLRYEDYSDVDPLFWLVSIIIFLLFVGCGIYLFFF